MALVLWLSGGNVGRSAQDELWLALVSGRARITGTVATYGDIGSITTDPVTAPYTGVDHIIFANSSTNILSDDLLWRTGRA